MGASAKPQKRTHAPRPEADLSAATLGRVAARRLSGKLCRVLPRDRPPILARGAAVVVWTAAFAHASDTIARRVANWPNYTATAYDVFSWAMAIGVMVIDAAVPLCVAAWFGVVVWLTGDIWVGVARRQERGDGDP